MDFNYKPGDSFDQRKVEITQDRLKKQSRQNDLPALRLELNNVIFVLSKLLGLIQDKQIDFPTWMRHFEILCIKFIQHTSSLNHLADPVPLAMRDDDSIVAIFDRPSLYVVARAQIEAFLMFYYLILSPETNEQGEFYDLVYELSGLCGRLEMPAKLPSSREQKARDEQRITELRQLIDSHVYLVNVNGQLKKKIEGSKPPARLFNGWEQLIRQSHLNEKIFLPRWKHYSAYAHSEFISILQLPVDFSNPALVQNEVCKTVEVTLMTIGIAITELLNLIPALQEDYSRIWSQEQRITIHFYSQMALKPNILIHRKL